MNLISFESNEIIANNRLKDIEKVQAGGLKEPESQTW